MRKTKITHFSLYGVCCVWLLVSCQPQTSKDALPQSTENVKSQEKKGIYRRNYVSDDTWDVDTIPLNNGYYRIEVGHKTFPFSYHVRFYDADSRLVMFATGASEAGAFANSYRVEYDEWGEVSGVGMCGLFEKLDEDTLQHVLKNVKVDWPIERDSNGNVIRIGDIDVPDGYSSDFQLMEGRLFWVSDLNGGHLFFATHIFPKRRGKGSYFERWYIDGVLALEEEFRKGKLITEKCYNQRGELIDTYENPREPLCIAEYADIRY